MLHVASPQAPRCIAPSSTLHKSSLFQVLVSPLSRRPLAPLQSLLSCMLRFHRNLPALFVRFPPVARTSRAFSLRPSVSRLASRLASCLSPSVPPLSRPVCCDSIATCPRFLPSSRLLPALPALPASFRLPPDPPSLPPPPLLPGLEVIQKKPSGIALGGLLIKNGGYLLSHGCAVPSARAGLTSLFGMGRGGTPPP